MLHIRLTRVGKKKQPTYRVIIVEKTRDPWGKALEILGNYNPRTKEKALVVDKERIKYWIEKGAQMSNTIHNLFLREGIISDQKKRKSVKISQKRAAKKVEKEKADAEAKAAAEEKAKAETAAAETPKEEAPAEEPKAEEAPKEEAPAQPAAEEPKVEEAEPEEPKAEEAPAEEPKE